MGYKSKMQLMLESLEQFPGDVSFTRPQGGLFIGAELPERIDISNFQEFSDELNKLRRENPNGEITLDLDKLDYISSAGLRVLVALVKSESSKPKLINVNPEINEIFEDVGIDTLMDITLKG